MNIIIECDTVEYATIRDKNNVVTAFSIQEKSVVISTMNAVDEILYQTEISYEDAVKLSELICHQAKNH